MENTTRPALHPALLVAAASVTALSLAGVGVLTGVLPFNHKAADVPAPAAALTAPVAAAPAATPPAAAPTVAVNITNTPAPAPARSVAKAAPQKPVRVARAEPADIDVYRYDRPPTQIRTAAPVESHSLPAICNDCGTITSVKEVARDGEGTGLGAVAGGALGGVIGNQVGNGNGRTVATLVGLIGGAMAGNHIEKTQKRVVQYEVTVRFEDGTSRVFVQDTAPGWRSGDRVRVENGLLVSRA